MKWAAVVIAAHFIPNRSSGTEPACPITHRTDCRFVAGVADYGRKNRQTRCRKADDRRTESVMGRYAMSR